MTMMIYAVLRLYRKAFSRYNPVHWVTTTEDRSVAISRYSIAENTRFLSAKYHGRVAAGMKTEASKWRQEEKACSGSRLTVVARCSTVAYLLVLSCIGWPKK